MGRYLAILAIIALGVGFFSGLKVTKPGMVETGNKYLREHNFYDFRLLSSIGFDADAVEEMRKQEHVLAADGSYYEDMIYEDAEGKADMLIGTQMIVKGHDYSNVTLVGVILADLSLYANDYRAGERTFDLLTQAAGRAGRGEKEGAVVIQTYQPEHYAIAAAASQDYKAFYEMEMAYRRMLRYPPVYDMLQILLTGESKGKVESYAGILCRDLKEKTKTLQYTQTRIIGPGEAAIGKINDEYRYVIYIKAPGLGAITTLRDYIDTCGCEGVTISVDMNPMTVC